MWIWLKYREELAYEKDFKVTRKHFNVTDIIGVIPVTQLLFTNICTPNFDSIYWLVCAKKYAQALRCMLYCMFCPKKQQNTYARAKAVFRSLNCVKSVHTNVGEIDPVEDFLFRKQDQSNSGKYKHKRQISKLEKNTFCRK